MIVTFQNDLDAISAILNETFKVPPFKRNYDETFAKIVRILCRYGIVENASISAFDLFCAYRNSLTTSHRISGT
jgi:hypothetical protein